MADSSAASTKLTSAHYCNASTEELERPHRTPTQAIVNFDGEVTTVRANTVRQLCCSKECVSFSMHCVALLIALIVGLVMMVIRGSGSPEFGLWTAIFSFGVGGFLPNPKLKDAGIR